jgi:hypothetical protein
LRKLCKNLKLVHCKTLSKIIALQKTQFSTLQKNPKNSILQKISPNKPTLSQTQINSRSKTYCSDQRRFDFTGCFRHLQTGKTLVKQKRLNRQAYRKSNKKAFVLARKKITEKKNKEKHTHSWIGLTWPRSRVSLGRAYAPLHGEHDRRKNFENYVLLHG